MLHKSGEDGRWSEMDKLRGTVTSLQKELQTLSLEKHHDTAIVKTVRPKTSKTIDDQNTSPHPNVIPRPTPKKRRQQSLPSKPSLSAAEQSLLEKSEAESGGNETEIKIEDHEEHHTRSSLEIYTESDRQLTDLPPAEQATSQTTTQKHLTMEPKGSPTTEQTLSQATEQLTQPASTTEPTSQKKSVFSHTRSSSSSSRTSSDIVQSITDLMSALVSEHPEIIHDTNTEPKTTIKHDEMGIRENSSPLSMDTKYGESKRSSRIEEDDHRRFSTTSMLQFSISPTKTTSLDALLPSILQSCTTTQETTQSLPTTTSLLDQHGQNRGETVENNGGSGVKDHGSGIRVHVQDMPAHIISTIQNESWFDLVPPPPPPLSTTASPTSSQPPSASSILESISIAMKTKRGSGNVNEEEKQGE
jgi:hypothetical protein